MVDCLATREGLDGGRTATGYLIERWVPFVALPSTAAMRLWVKIYNPLTKAVVHAIALDCGPWNTTDHQYVFQPATVDHIGLVVPPETVRPQAESGTDTRGRKTNGAGIDLGERVWALLGMKDNGTVLWEFL